MTTPCDPLITRFDVPLSTGVDGPLSGLSAAVKDNFDIAGHVTGNGSPEWRDSHGAAEQSGTLVARFLDAGCAMIGKSQLDEMAYSLMGRNARYGTPRNPAAPDRVPGGSSSGSAVLVASGAVDIGIGSDTGGSVRVPAAFTGTIGLRPTHDSLPVDGLVPLAPSYDTPGFFTRDLSLMARVLAVASGTEVQGKALRQMRAPSDLWALAHPETRAALEAALPDAPTDHTPIAEDGALGDWFEAFRIHQAFEIWQTHGAWVREARPAFGPGIAERFQAASRITPEEFAQAQAARARITARLHEALPPGTCLLLPTIPAPAPSLTATEADLDDFRRRAITLLCVAGHAGLPQLSLPVPGPGGLPLGLSLVGSRGAEADLIATAQEVFAR